MCSIDVTELKEYVVYWGRYENIDIYHAGFMDGFSEGVDPVNEDEDYMYGYVDGTSAWKRMYVKDIVIMYKGESLRWI
tara:strand:- start:1332 stop:1565 length:234 start_codon:yes stop_codon:yes gene_type:complete